MFCLECGNCRRGETLFYCTGKNEFVVQETAVVRERSSREGDGEPMHARWRKGDPNYEWHRRQLRKDKVSQIS